MKYSLKSESCKSEALRLELTSADFGLYRTEVGMAPMKPAAWAALVATSVQAYDGPSLSRLFDLRDMHVQNVFLSLAPGDTSLENPHPGYAGVYSKKLPAPHWPEMAIAHTQAIIALHDRRPDPLTGRPRPPGGDAVIVYQKTLDALNAFYRWMMAATEPTGWALHLLFVLCRDLKQTAIVADEHRAARGEKRIKLEEASRLLQKCFSACLNDRSSDVFTSRKMGTYYMAVLLFKVYFRLKSTALCKNLIKGIGAVELAPFEQYPLSHQVPFMYYMGVFAFLREDYAEAEAKFVEALTLCHARADRNVELILDYLIPLLLLRGVFPSQANLQRSPRLTALYAPFIEAFKTGNVALYDEQLLKGEKRLMERGTYLVVERAREGAVRALMKKAWICAGKPARMTIEQFGTCYVRGSDEDETDKAEVECLLANLIYKGLLKGYISHAHQVVVLSKDRPFPWYAPFRDRGEAYQKARTEREVAERAKQTV